MNMQTIQTLSSEDFQRKINYILGRDLLLLNNEDLLMNAGENLCYHYMYVLLSGIHKLCVRNLCYLRHKNVIIILRANLNEKIKTR